MLIEANSGMACQRAGSFIGGMTSLGFSLQLFVKSSKSTAEKKIEYFIGQWCLIKKVRNGI